MRIRQATRNDADRLAVLCGEIQELHCEMQPTLFRHPSPEELAAFFRERIADPSIVIFLAQIAEEPVGYVMLHLIRRPAHVFINARSCVEIDHIHVRRAHRRRGIGRALAAQALAVAREAGIETIQLNVWAQNANAVAAFKSMGFAPQRHVMVLEDKGKLGLY